MLYIIFLHLNNKVLALAQRVCSQKNKVGICLSYYHSKFYIVIDIIDSYSNFVIKVD